MSQLTLVSFGLSSDCGAPPSNCVRRSTALTWMPSSLSSRGSPRRPGHLPSTPFAVPRVRAARSRRCALTGLGSRVAVLLATALASMLAIRGTPCPPPRRAPRPHHLSFPHQLPQRESHPLRVAACFFGVAAAPSPLPGSCLPRRQRSTRVPPRAPRKREWGCTASYKPRRERWRGREERQRRSSDARCHRLRRGSALRAHRRPSRGAARGEGRERLGEASRAAARAAQAA